MAIKIKVRSKEEEKVKEAPVPNLTMELDIRRTLDDNLVISDHPDVDIAVYIKEDKIVIFPKEILNEMVYDTQDRFFKFMTKKGIVNPETVRGGNTYGSMEGMFLSGDGGKEESLPLVVLNIEKFINKEKPHFEYIEKYREMEEEQLLDPEGEDSTELGEVPQEETKGSIRPGYGGVESYYLNYIYEALGL